MGWLAVGEAREPPLKEGQAAATQLVPPRELVHHSMRGHEYEKPRLRESGSRSHGGSRVARYRGRTHWPPYLKQRTREQRNGAGAREPGTGKNKVKRGARTRRTKQRERVEREEVLDSIRWFRSMWTHATAKPPELAASWLQHRQCGGIFLTLS